MFSTGRFRRALFVALLLCCAAPSYADQAPADASLYRVFLNDGTTLVSYGEFARVADRVVVSLPLGTALHLLSIPADTVD